MSTIDDQIAALKARASDRRSTDLLVIFVGLGASITVLVPWLIGRWVMRGWFFRENAGDVYDIRVREDGWYFPSDWAMGCAVIAFVVALVLLLRPWSHRIGSVVVGFVVVALASALLIPGSISAWRDGEAQSARALDSTAYPFSDEFYNCGSGEYMADDGFLYQAYSARISGSDVDGCNRIVIYRGWTEIAHVDLPDGRTVREIFINSKGTLRITADNDKVVAKFPITSPPER